ncbi:hypothetical protein KGA66_00425 [Actinocrinis puniceicyclus]|uniref:Uncharacterized protein n=1 Tax=Actinocrinis puniceicyclus TaxID=977794 RepID=A0A8J7WL35_9ACTN|nr:DUF6084 family protein [Actinocrinis puniceicyclus]MBS2961489.1 hypothetical protein [Actinocrinis puniceicyclus]
MTEFSFDCTGIAAQQYSAAPALDILLRISETTGARIDAVALRCQVRIEPTRRRYGRDEAARLYDLFGDAARWPDTLKPLQVATLTAVVPGFRGATDTVLPLPCNYDLDVACAKYFHALDDGEIPLLLLFSGTVFRTDTAAGQDGRIQVEQVPWSKECAYRLPVKIWREAIDRHFPAGGWIRAGRETLDALQRFKSAQALTTWDATLEALLRRAGERADDRA